MPTISETKNIILETLRLIGISEGEARSECLMILQHVTKASTAEQVVRANEIMSAVDYTKVEEILERRRQRAPIQYCLGSAWFMNSEFIVEPGVFIPRPDTETLVQTCSELISASDNQNFRSRLQVSELFELRKLRVVEVGIGSGAISVSLLKQHHQIEIIALELSAKPCEISRKNAQINGVSDRLEIQQGDWRGLLPENIDVLVSNPPYIPTADALTLEPEVGHHEPKEALYGTDDDGLGFYRDFAKIVPAHLREGCGFIAVEVGDIQSGSVSQIFATAGWTDINVKLDMNGIPRVVTARKS